MTNKQQSEKIVDLVTDAASAEFLGALDAVETVSSGLAFNQSVFELATEQWRQTARDWKETLKVIPIKGVDSDLVTEHVKRRVNSHATGLAKLSGLILQEQYAFYQNNIALWAPFASIVKDDLK